ncbi:hypothetical protein [Leucobacter tenebrionis]|uniref:hypothetical protein n=1 Tax=Leucobacter tenebrionis TaxID=2873270 RepID=UPI001CA675D3|nr:hypothetical protein [Leucobacter tenebrionis]QZY52373.1 hypothetical protein KVY00_02585 [Leucobacter tenebrionis]
MPENTDGTPGSMRAALAWPDDPFSAWAQAVRSPEPYERLTDPPDIDSADAASIADWIEDQRSALPMLAIVCAAVGAIVIGGLVLGILPRTDSGAEPASMHWAGGIALLVASAVLWVWEVLSRRRRRARPPILIPEVRVVLCELHPTRFNIHDGDGYRETCVAIAEDASDAQAERIFTAFRIWLARLEEDQHATSLARNEHWRPSDANVFGSEEIFGPDAAGGYLVRRPSLPADGWGVLLTPRRPARLVGRLRFADIRRWTGTGWSL